MHSQILAYKKTTAYQYAENVVKGKIRAGKYIKLECKRFIEDLEKQYLDDSFEWIFDIEVYDFIVSFQNFFKFADGIMAGQPMKLAHFQEWILGNLFCWKHKEHGYIRFTKAFIQIARKQGKSMLLGYIGFIKSLLYEYAQVYCTATKKDQAEIVIKEIKKMLDQAIPSVKKRFEIYGKATISKIMCKVTQSEMAPLSSDANTLDGLGMDLAIVDEFGAHKNYELYEVCRSSQTYKTSAQIVAITTAYPNTTTSPAYIERCLLVDMYEGIIPMDERYFCALYELDEEDLEDLDNTENWCKANPLFIQFPEIMKRLESDYNSAKNDPQKLMLFKTKNLNIWCQGEESISYLDFEEWKKAQVDKVDFEGEEVIVGVDLSKTTDLTAVSIMSKDAYGRIKLKSKAFLPKAIINQKEVMDKMPYSSYISGGHDWVTATEGKFVDQLEIERYIRSIEDTFRCKIKSIAFDSYQGLHLMSSLKNDYEVIDVQMTYKNFSPAIKRFREEVYDGNLIHEYNPILNFCAGNAIEKSDLQENILLDKKRSANRIDLLVASIIAYAEILDGETNEEGGDYFMI